VTVKKLLPVLALVAAAAAYWFLLLAPKRQEVADLGAKISKAEGQLQAFESTVATYEAARKSYNANYTRLTSLGKAVPSDDDLRSLIVQLDATVAERDVEFETLEASGDGGTSSGGSDKPAAGGATTPPGTVAFGSAGMAAMPLQFTLTGKYEDLSAALGDLEKFVKVRGRRFDVRGRLLRVEGFSLAPGTGGFPSLRTQVRATAYLMPETTGVSGAGAEPAATAGAAAAATPSSGEAPTTPQAATITGVAR
jgi:Tfp pilus assembly protein PilO